MCGLLYIIYPRTVLFWVFADFKVIVENINAGLYIRFYGLYSLYSVRNK